MDRLLARLERVFGRFTIENLPMFLTGGLGIAYVLSMLRPEFVSALLLDPMSVRHGQVWRLLSFVFVPAERAPLWALIALWFFYGISRDLEAAWGSFRFNAYYATGMVLTIAGSFLTGAPTAGIWLNGSLFLAFASVFPDAQVLLIVFPVRARILGWITGAFYAYQAFTGGWSARVGIGAAFLTYLLFFAGTLRRGMRERQLLAVQAARRESMRAPPPSAPSSAPEIGHRRCAICGALEEEGADIRVCSCEKCGGKPRTLCLEHARNH